LTEKAPRIKWESAKVVGNIAHLYPDKLDEAIKNLLINSEHTGTVVRWSAAFALGQIIKLRTSRNRNLIPAIESICKREEKNSIKKIYIAALKGIS
jgi:HEAT repeat protein